MPQKEIEKKKGCENFYFMLADKLIYKLRTKISLISNQYTMSLQVKYILVF